MRQRPDSNLTSLISIRCWIACQENEQHLGKGENNTVVNQVRQGMKNAWRETCEETLGRKSKQHKAYASVDTLKKIEARKKVFNCSTTKAKKAETQIRYSETNKEVKRSLRKTEGTSGMTSQDR